MENLYIYFMDDLIIKPTRRTPEVILVKGNIKFKGRSVPTNPEMFYQPLFDWIKAYSSVAKGPTKIELNFEYINTASTKWIFSMLKQMGATSGSEKELDVTWYYEEGDDDMYDLGVILQSLVHSRFQLIKTSE